MNKKTLIIAFVLFIGLCSAQNEIYQKVSTFIKQNNSEMVVQNKILVINFNNLDQGKDKGGYASLEKTGNVYQVAKLKGGRSGVICVTVVKNAQAEVVLNKKGYDHILVINSEQLGALETTGIDNITFNDKGEVVYKNLESTKIYEAINQLITR